MRPWNPDAYARAWAFATSAHAGQTYGSPREGERVPYISHVGEVAAEVMCSLWDAPDCDADLAIAAALLHDTVEDTSTTVEQLSQQFGPTIAAGVSALTKRDDLPSKAESMADSLRRIRLQPKEIWMVKLADRIVNLSAPPFPWPRDKARRYRAEALDIHAALSEAHAGLAERLLGKIERYRRFTGE